MSDRPPVLTRPFLTLTAAHFLQALGYTSMLLLPLYLNHLGASRREIGQIMAVSAVGGLLLRPVIGWALDQIGRKPTLVAGTLCLALGMAAFWGVTDVGWLVYAARIIVGIGTGVLFTGYFAFASDMIPPSRRTEGLALFGISGLTPLMINPLSGQIGIAPPDLRWFFPLLGAVIALSILPLLLVPEAPKRADAPAFSARDTLRAVLRHELRPVWLATIAFSGMVSTYMAFATVTAGDRGLSTPANLWFSYAAGAIVVRAAGGAILDRIGPRRLLPTSLGGFGVAFLLTAVADAPVAFYLAALLAGFGHGLGFPVLTSQLVGRTPEHLRGSGIAALTALWEVAALGLTPLFGAIGDLFSDAALFYAGATVAFSTLLVWWPLERRIERSRAPLS